MILMLGDPRTVTQPGVALRIPLLETVRSYERRLLYLNTPPNDDPDARPGGPGGRQLRRLADRGSRAVLRRPSPPAAARPSRRSTRWCARRCARWSASTRSPTCCTGKRGEIMQMITEKTNRALGKFGIALEDVRINRTELPQGHRGERLRAHEGRARAPGAQVPRRGRGARAPHPRRGGSRGARDRRERAARRRDRARRGRRRRRRASTPRPTRPTRSSTPSCAASRPTARRSASTPRWCSRRSPSSSASWIARRRRAVSARPSARGRRRARTRARRQAPKPREGREQQPGRERGGERRPPRRPAMAAVRSV